MKILYLTNESKPRFDFFYQSLSDNNHEIHVLNAKDSLKKYKDIKFHKSEKINTINRHVSSIGKICSKLYFEKLIRDINPDIFHLVNIGEKIYSRHIDRTNSLSIVRPVGSDVFRYPWQSYENYKNTINLLKKFDYVITKNEFTRKYIYYNFKIPRNKLYNLRYGSDLEKISDIHDNLSKKNIYEEWGLSEDDFIIFLPRGMRNVFKPIVNFFSILEELKRKYPSLKVITSLRGKSEIEYIIKQKIKNYKFHDDLIFIKERISHKKMLELFEISNLTISMAESDQISFAIQEAMYLKNIPVLSDLPVYEVCFDKYDNYIPVNNLDPGDLFKKVSYCIENYDEIIYDMYPKNKDIIEEKFDRKKQMKKLPKLYEHLLNKKKSKN